MPIYEYECQSCSHRFEAKQKFNDPPLTACERCGQSVRKVISAPAIMFKGSGWYVTDYSNKLKPESTDGTAEKSGDASDKASADKGSEKGSEQSNGQKPEQPTKQAEGSGTSSSSQTSSSSDSSSKQTSQTASGSS